MRRTLWFAAGAGAGVYALTKTRRLAEVFTADGLADRLAALSVGVRLFREELLAGAAEAESGVRQRLGVPAAPQPQQLTAGTAPHHPTQTREATS